MSASSPWLCDVNLEQKARQMGDKYVVVRSVLPQIRLEFVDLAAQFLMCLPEAQAEGDCTVTVVRSH